MRRRSVYIAMFVVLASKISASSVRRKIGATYWSFFKYSKTSFEKFVKLDGRISGSSYWRGYCIQF
jgi:hypothetical protein